MNVQYVFSQSDNDEDSINASLLFVDSVFGVPRYFINPILAITIAFLSSKYAQYVKQKYFTRTFS